MMTLKQKQHIINNDVNWKHVNKTSLTTLITIITIFLTTIQLMVI